MNVNYSKRFIKQVEKLDLRTKKLLANTIIEIRKLNKISETPNCIKMSGYKKVYRIRISEHRAIFLHEEEDSIFFEYIASRGDTYTKKYKALIKGE